MGVVNWWMKVAPSSWRESTKKRPEAAPHPRGTTASSKKKSRAGRKQGRWLARKNHELGKSTRPELLLRPSEMGRWPWFLGADVRPNPHGPESADSCSQSRVWDGIAQ